MPIDESPDCILPATPVSLNLGTLRILIGSVEVIPADSIRVEDSKTPKYLRLRSGDIQVYSSVLISVDGNWYELTEDCLPDEAQHRPKSATALSTCLSTHASQTARPTH